MTEDIYTLVIEPGSSQVEQHGPMYVDWGRAPFAGYIGGDLRAVAGDGDEDDEYNAAGTTVANALRREDRLIYGSLGIQRHDREPMTAIDIAFVESLIAHPAAVAALHPLPGSIDLVATVPDWRTLRIAGEVDDHFPVEEDCAEVRAAVNASERLMNSERGVADGRITVQLDDAALSVELVERGELDAGHLESFLDERFGYVEYSARRSLLCKAAHEYRESEHWSIATLMRTLRQTESEDTLTLMLTAFTQGAAEELVFAAVA
ncbi:hypothetical protein AB1K56_03250 [Microbacterium sp. BWR-S6Y]|uniref:hypothetical protein n=1 Tax=Microbacterium sp. BWR-S6Y TaxID=3232073 RepID=UPI0035271C4C